MVFDDVESRVKRDMQQEGFTAKIAREHVQRHDDKVSNWTNFLFHKQAYDRSLYDIVIPLKNKNILDIAADIIEQFETITSLDEPTVEDLIRICTGDFIKALFQYKLITNIRSYEMFQSKGNDVKIRFAKGLKLTHDKITESEE